MAQEALTLGAQQTEPSAAQQAALWVFYDGGCPACRLEMAHYAHLSALAPVRFVDASVDALPALDAEQVPDRALLLARLHVRTASGQWRSGADAFATLWQHFPRWRWLGRVVALPGVKSVAELAYCLFLKLRPLWRKPSLCSADTCR